MKAVIIGPPGSGKGTIAKGLLQGKRTKHFSIGEMLRVHQHKNTALGKAVRLGIEKGKLVPDALVQQLLAKELKHTTNFLLDGFPRTLKQAHWLDNLVDTVLVLEAPDKELIKRISARRVCPVCGTNYNLVSDKPQKACECNLDHHALTRRKDDTPAVVKERLRIYHKQSQPILNYYEKKGILKHINADQSIPLVLAEARNALLTK